MFNLTFLSSTKWTTYSEMVTKDKFWKTKLIRRKHLYAGELQLEVYMDVYFTKLTYYRKLKYLYVYN